ncbi:MAG: transglycosylase SLT domain-containing protein [Pseudomonadota bacterium]
MKCGTFQSGLSPFRTILGTLALFLVCQPVWSQPGAALSLIEEARSAIERGDEQAFQSLKGQLENDAEHPLSPYLDYWSLMARLGEAEAVAVSDFLDAQPLSHLRRYLLGSWLHRLAREKRWDEFRRFDNGRGSAQLRCYAGQAALASDSVPDEDKLATARSLWLVPGSQPAACDPVFDWLENRGELSESLISARQQLALDHGQYALARYLQRQLPEESHAYRDWMRILADPDALRAPHFDNDSQLHRQLAIVAARRHLEESVEHAESFWLEQASRYAFTPDQHTEVEQLIALRAAQRHREDAVARVAGLDPATLDESGHAWRVRAALRRGDWPSVEAFIGDMPEALQRSDRWLYWRARAAEQLGQPEVASRAWRLIASERGYYGFLAAERINAHYRFDRAYPEVDETALQAMASEGAFERARWLMAMGEKHLARVEWQTALAEAPAPRLERAAALAARWGWHEMAIRAAARAGAMDAIGWRFARPWEPQLSGYSHDAGIDKHWARAVMRRESAYNPEARSSANARGLMQLLPSTAREVARRQGLATSPDLFLPEDNIRLGTAYLSYLKGRMMGSEVLATAAYNAGPERVEEWLPGEEMDTDVWVETIPYRETRRYVRAVSEYRAIFQWLENGAPATAQRASVDYQLGLARQKVSGETLLARGETVSAP